MLPEKKTHTASVATKQVWQSPYPKIIRKRAKRLKISSKELRECSLAGLKKLAKRNFGLLIKHHHPDTRQKCKNEFSQNVMFGKLVRVYHFIYNLKEKDIEKFRQTEKENEEWKHQDQDRYYFLLQWPERISIPDGFQELRR